MIFTRRGSSRSFCRNIVDLISFGWTRYFIRTDTLLADRLISGAMFICVPLIKTSTSSFGTPGFSIETKKERSIVDRQRARERMHYHR